MTTLAIERLTADEVRTMDLRAQVDSLADVITATLALGRELITARTKLAHAQIAALREPSTETKSAVLMNKAILDTLGIRARTLRQMCSILQSLIRAASI